MYLHNQRSRVVGHASKEFILAWLSHPTLHMTLLEELTEFVGEVEAIYTPDKRLSLKNLIII